MAQLLISLALGISLVVAGVITAFFVMEVIAAFLPARSRNDAIAKFSGRVVIVVPAHNEGIHIVATLTDIMRTLPAGGECLVIADNCVDDTAKIAANLGARVLERHDPERRGKGYALQFAINALRDAPPDIVVFFDADCEIGEGVISELCARSAAYERPIQAYYAMGTSTDPTPRDQIASFAWLLINRVRMGGLARLFDVTRFTGVGLATPWSLLEKVNFGGAALTEDHAISFSLTQAGAGPLYASDLTVSSRFPETDEARVTQRARWEHGSVGNIFRFGLSSFIKGIMSGDFRLAALGLDAMVPPLVLHGCLLSALTLIALIASPFVGLSFTFIALTLVAVFVTAIIVAWIRFGRDVLPATALSGAPIFLLEKLRIYGGEGRKSSKTWTRTDRD